MFTQKSRTIRAAIAGFAIGASVPLFWGVLGMLFFSVREGWLSRAFWRAVYLTCPFWGINGDKALILMPLFNGLMYAAFALLMTMAYTYSRRATPGH
jgi:hypothetical protein